MSSDRNVHDVPRLLEFSSPFFFAMVKVMHGARQSAFLPQLLHIASSLGYLSRADVSFELALGPSRLLVALGAHEQGQRLGSVGRVLFETRSDPIFDGRADCE